MQEAVLKIKELGVPPEGFAADTFPGDEEFPPDDILDLWDEYEDAIVSIRSPITWEEAEILIKCCPTDHMAGIEWTLLHCIESVVTKTAEELERYRNLIEQCKSDMMKEALLKRFESYLSKQS